MNSIKKIGGPNQTSFVNAFCIYEKKVSRNKINIINSYISFYIFTRAHILIFTVQPNLFSSGIILTEHRFNKIVISTNRYANQIKRDAYENCISTR